MILRGFSSPTNWSIAVGAYRSLKGCGKENPCWLDMVHRLLRNHALHCQHRRVIPAFVLFDLAVFVFVPLAGNVVVNVPPLGRYSLGEWLREAKTGLAHKAPTISRAYSPTKEYSASFNRLIA